MALAHQFFVSMHYLTYPSPSLNILQISLNGCSSIPHLTFFSSNFRFCLISSAIESYAKLSWIDLDIVSKNHQDLQFSEYLSNLSKLLHSKTKNSKYMQMGHWDLIIMLKQESKNKKKVIRTSTWTMSIWISKLIYDLPNKQIKDQETKIPYHIKCSLFGRKLVDLQRTLINSTTGFLPPN